MKINELEENTGLAPLPSKIAPGHVLIKNPMFGVDAEAIDKELNRLPAKEKENYLHKTMQNYWEKLEVVFVGAGVGWIEVGDMIMGNADIMNNVSVLPTKEYMILRESHIKSVY